MTIDAGRGAGRFGLSYPWTAHRRLALRVAPLLNKRGMGRLSAALLTPLERHGHANVEVVETLHRTYRKLGLTRQADDYRAKILRGRALRAARSKALDRPVQNLLRALAGLERMQIAAPLPAAARLTALMSDIDSAGVLLAASEPVIAEFPDSTIVIYARAVALARSEHIQEASRLVTEATKALTAVQPVDAAATKDRKARLDRLGSVWRVVDAIARDKMAWATGGEVEAEAPAESGDGKDAPLSDNAVLRQEALLQGRSQARYLAACAHRLESETTLRGKMIAIKAMLRQGLRRLPAYNGAYAAAAAAYDSVRSEWTPMLVSDPEQVGPDLIGKDAGLKVTRLLIQILQMARELQRHEDIAALEAALLAIGGVPRARTSVWTIASVLVDGDPARFTAATTVLVERAGAPGKPHEVRDFLAWAARARRHDMAHAFFAKASDHIRQSHGAIHYAKILQREGRFDQALKLTEKVTATVLARPDAFDPMRHWNLLKRIKELEFLAESAKWLHAVPQPETLTGVVFVAPRSAGQLTRYPMAVLLELKRQGWAIVPLVEGVMPLDPTGDPVIDQFMGSLLQDVRLNPDIEAMFEPVQGFSPRIDRGELTWNDIDLSQPLWEEAAIHRRRFTIDYSCPSLQKHLGRLAEWTRLHATVLHNARKRLKRRKLRVAFMAPFQARLPDAVNRFYCAQHGDPRDFFSVHVSNGYENYFVNFAHLTSTKAAMRNMTAHPELRSAGFPVPAEFLAWYEDRKDQGPAMLEQVRDTTKVRRSTRTTATPPPEALACLDRVRAWRADGGKVACAFGKVVCDMSAPIDGGPAHRDLKDWLNHTIQSVKGSDTLLLIKPHPHELRNEIGTFLTEYLTDLIQGDLPDNVIVTGHDWFDLHDLDGLIDVGLIYNGTTAVELGLMNIPAVVCADYAPVDYPVGHMLPRNRAHYRKLVRFENPVVVAEDLSSRSAAWIHYMSGDTLTIPYRYHARPTTNKVVTPPRWFREDIAGYLKHGDPNVMRLAERVTGPRRVKATVAATRRPRKPADTTAKTPSPTVRRRRPRATISD